MKLVTLAFAGWLTGAALVCGDEPKAEKRGGDDSIVVALNLPYRGEGGNKACVLDLAMPKDRAAGPRPAIVVIHGGGWIEGDKSSFTSAEHGVPGNIVEFARLGFVAATINYRLSREAPFPAGARRLSRGRALAAGPCRRIPDRSERIGAYGNSAGGHLALLLAMMPVETPAAGEPNASESSGVQAACSDSGPIDLAWQIDTSAASRVVGTFMGGPPEGRG